MQNLINKISCEPSTEQSSASDNYKKNKAELFSIIDPANPDSKKSKFPKFITLLKKCSFEELIDSSITSDNFVLTEILKNSDFLQDLDCFEVKEIVKIWERAQTNTESLPTKAKNDDLRKLFKLATHKAVMGSARFELINQEKALTEGDFDPTKLSDLKTQLNIDGNLDAEGLMKLFFTLKYFGEENNFISAIKPEKILQNPLLNYNLKFEMDELNHLSIVRTQDSKNSKQKSDLKEVREGLFKKLKEGDKHFCTTFFRSEFIGQGFNDLSAYDADHGIVADLDLPNAGHFAGDFWSEHFLFPRSRRFEGQDVSRLRAFGAYKPTFCRYTRKANGL